MISNRLFGTDGIRTSICAPTLDPANMARLGRILANIIKSSGLKNCITIGRDTRASGEFIENALIAGITYSGVDCICVGVLPTSGVAYLGQRSESAFSLVISASHNTYVDNGIKIFGHKGQKIDQKTENLIEEQFFSSKPIYSNSALDPGQIFFAEEAQKHYLAMLLESWPKDLCLKNLRLVVDCGHGSAFTLARQLFAQLSCTTKFIGCTPDGKNINSEYGSENTANLSLEVVKFKADLGIAFDGDADRVVFIDETGQQINGEAILALMAINLKNANLLQDNTLVSTIMSSAALDSALLPHNIKVIRTDVGDRQVARTLFENNLSFGGENSGHLIFAKKTSTGDGLFSALQFLAIIIKSASLKTSQICNFYKKTPSILKNILVTEKIPLSDLPKTSKAINSFSAHLKNTGRILLRYSGTEMKARLLVEASTQTECQKIADSIAQEFELEILSKTYSINHETKYM